MSIPRTEIRNACRLQTDDLLDNLQPSLCVLCVLGECYLYVKEVERAMFPDKQWERIRLSRNYGLACRQIHQQLVYWPLYATTLVCIPIPLLLCIYFLAFEVSFLAIIEHTLCTKFDLTVYARYTELKMIICWFKRKIHCLHFFCIKRHFHLNIFVYRYLPISSFQ